MHKFAFLKKKKLLSESCAQSSLVTLNYKLRTVDDE